MIRKSTPRYERKFHVVDLRDWEVEALVRSHPAMFLEPYPPRQVNNIYLDSFGLDCYRANLDGVADRAKFRIRWYGDLLGLIQRPVLEIKQKMGLVGHKETFPLVAFLLDSELTRDTLKSVFVDSGVPVELLGRLQFLGPALLNCYRRAYFRTADGRVRLTLDTHRRFFRLRSRNNQFLRCHEDDVSTIVELKYELSEESRAAEIANRFPFRLTKSSKYAQGIESLEPF